MSRLPIHTETKPGAATIWDSVIRALLSGCPQVFGRPRTAVARRLRMELLESRQVMASDLASHSAAHAVANLDLDVNCDSMISAEELSLASAISSGRSNPSNPYESDGGGATAAARGGPAKPLYQYWITGNSAPKEVVPTPGLALIGGGSDVEEAFRWLGEKANGGDFLVLTASSNGIYNNYISRLSKDNPLDSVETLQIPSLDAANDPFVKAKINEADAIFITGGDQSNYVNFWDETAVEDAIYGALARGVPIGGTSAGLAVLGDFDFSAVVDTISSEEALRTPSHPAITLDGNFLSEREFVAELSPPPEPIFTQSPLVYLTDTITDSHFQQRDRMGRLVTFMARLDAANANDDVWRGIGINEQTALLIEADGEARVIGNPYLKSVDDALEQRSVFFLSREATISGQLVAPFNYNGVQVARATYDPICESGDTFDLDSWVGSGDNYISYTVSVTNGGFGSTNPYGALNLPRTCV